jgi:hypothetical protein
VGTFVKKKRRIRRKISSHATLHLSHVLCTRTFPALAPAAHHNKLCAGPQAVLDAALMREAGKQKPYLPRKFVYSLLVYETEQKLLGFSLQKMNTDPYMWVVVWLIPGHFHAHPLVSFLDLRVAAFRTEVCFRSIELALKYH